MLFEPEKAFVGPRQRVVKGRFIAQTHSMFAILVNEQLKRHVVFPERFSKEHAVFHRGDLVGKGCPEEA